MNNRLTEKEGKILLRLARETIAEKLGRKAKQEGTLNFENRLEKNVFNEKRGVFVTLHKNGHLRGCIGSLDSSETIRQSVIDNARNAAFHDPRFSSLKVRELSAVDIEVSILTSPKRVEYSDGDDLLKKLRPDIDGVIIKKGRQMATFLPQVWEQLSTPEAFLSHLCSKAGLDQNEWARGELEVQTYQVQYFEESR